MFHLLCLLYLTFKTREMAFQLLRRTAWASNKAFKSRMTKTLTVNAVDLYSRSIEHLLCECEYYSELTWRWLGDIITQYLNTDAADLVPRVEIGQHTVIFNTVKKPCRNAPNSDVGTGGAEPKDGGLGIFRPPRRLVRATVVHIGIVVSSWHTQSKIGLIFGQIRQNQSWRIALAAKGGHAGRSVPTSRKRTKTRI